MKGEPPAKWIYIDKQRPPAHNGIEKIVLTSKTAKVPGLVQVVVSARRGTYALGPGQEPITVTVELNDIGLAPGGTPGVDLCGESVFRSPPLAPSCVFNDAKRLICK